MTGSEIGELVGGVVILLGALASYLKAKAAAISAASAHARITTIQRQMQIDANLKAQGDQK